jgi:3-oxoadipate enol-lactonase
MLHGQPGGGRDWGRVVQALGTRAQAVAIDRPGWDGQSQAEDLAGNGQAALSALEARGIERAAIVGHSLGAAIAVWLAVHHPERVSSLVLAAPAANRASLAAFDRWLTVPVAGALISGVSLTGLGLALSTGPVRRRIARRSGLPEGYLRDSGRSLLTPWARRAFDTEQRTLVRELPALDRRLGDVAAPTWILTGAWDRIVPPDAPRALARQIDGAQLRVLDRAGHLLPQLHARPLAEAIMVALGAGANS